MTGSAPAGDFTDPATAFDDADRLVAGRILSCRRGRGRPIAVGLAGAQGSGKSTMAARLPRHLEEAGLRVAVASLDDFYLMRAERAELGRRVHPLLATRGVPGTHDVTLACRTVDALLNGGDAVPVPRFDKTRDDRAPAREWPRYAAPVDVVLLEGWCVGVRPMPDQVLEHPVNALERDEDGDGAWRRHANAALRSQYVSLFDRLSLIFLLRAPGFQAVEGWRMQQERGLEWSQGGATMMDEAGIRRFVAHYQRLTCWMLRDEPVDVVLDVDVDRRPVRWRPGTRRIDAGPCPPEDDRPPCGR